MTGSLENNKIIPLVLIAAIALSIVLFWGLLRFADEGNLFLVVLMAVLISVVAFAAMKVISLQQRMGKI